jgi:hypothetical protein
MVAHAEDVKEDISGRLNNMRPIFGDVHPNSSPYNPLNWNLMADPDYGFETHRWLVFSQAVKLSTNSEAHFSFRFRW